MEVDNIITLENNKNYLLLLESELTDDNYFLSVLLDENDEPTKDYAVLKEIKKEDGSYALKINNPLVLQQLIEDYKLQLSDMEEA